MRILSFPLKRATATVVLVAFAVTVTGCGGGAYNPTAPTAVPSSSTPSAAAAALSEDSVSPPVVDDTVPVLDDSETFISTNGIRTWALKKALGGLAKSLRSSGLRWVLNKARQYGGREVADAIERHAFRIADKLDELARWEDVSLQAVEDQTYNLLLGLGVRGDIARGAGFAIKNILWVFL